MANFWHTLANIGLNLGQGYYQGLADRNRMQYGLRREQYDLGRQREQDARSRALFDEQMAEFARNRQINEQTTNLFRGLPQAGNITEAMNTAFAGNYDPGALSRYLTALPGYFQARRGDRTVGEMFPSLFGADDPRGRVSLSDFKDFATLKDWVRKQNVLPPEELEREFNLTGMQTGIKQNQLGAMTADEQMTPEYQRFRMNQAALGNAKAKEELFRLGRMGEQNPFIQPGEPGYGTTIRDTDLMTGTRDAIYRMKGFLPDDVIAAQQEGMRQRAVGAITPLGEQFPNLNLGPAASMTPIQAEMAGAASAGALGLTQNNYLNTPWGQLRPDQPPPAGMSVNDPVGLANTVAGVGNAANAATVANRSGDTVETVFARNAQALKDAYRGQREIPPAMIQRYIAFAEQGMADGRLQWTPDDLNRYKQMLLTLKPDVSITYGGQSFQVPYGSEQHMQYAAGEEAFRRQKSLAGMRAAGSSEQMVTIRGGGPNGEDIQVPADDYWRGTRTGKDGSNAAFDQAEYKRLKDMTLPGSNFEGIEVGKDTNGQPITLQHYVDMVTNQTGRGTEAARYAREILKVALQKAAQSDMSMSGIPQWVLNEYLRRAAEITVRKGYKPPNQQVKVDFWSR